MICPNCKNEFVPVKKHGYTPKFCSRICANGGRIASDEAKASRSSKVKEWLASRTEEDISRAAQKAAETLKQKRAVRLVSQDFETLSRADKRKRISLEQNHQCVSCGQTEIWNGLPLKFHLDHVDGNRADNSRQNLRLICPNCHSQTTTYCGKNNYKVTDETLLNALRSLETINQALLFVGLQPSKKNYSRARLLLG